MSNSCQVVEGTLLNRIRFAQMSGVTNVFVINWIYLHFELVIFWQRFPVFQR